MKLFTFFLLAFIIYAANAKTILWTSAGGTSLWEFPNNWDCLCVPTRDDDVIINVANIPGVVRIGGTPAFARTLTVGGNSNFGQTLYVSGNLTVNGGRILGNGAVTLDAGAFFNTTNAFDGDSRLTFISGTLGGPGTFNFLNINFTGPALKSISGNTVVSGILFVDPGKGAQGVISVVSGTLTVSGTLRTTETLTISAFPAATISITGILNFLGTTNNILTVRGKTMIGQLVTTGGTVTLNDNVTVTIARLGSGSTLNLIGSPASLRTIGDILGLGVLQIQGGTNYFSTMSGIANIMLTGGTLITDTRNSIIGSLTQSGGEIRGRAQLTATTLSLSNAQIKGTPIVTQNLEMKGFTSLDAASLTVTGMGIVSSASQITFNNGSTFNISKTARISQAAALKLLPAGNARPSLFLNDGRWTSTSNLQINIDAKGNGSYEFGNGATTIVTAVAFNADSLTLTGASLTLTVATAFIHSIDGRSGTIDNQGSTIFVTGNANVATFINENGFFTVGTGNFGTVDVRVGNWNVTGSGATVGTLRWEGGEISSTPAKHALVTVTNTMITGNEPKTLVDITMATTNLSLICGTQQCQLFTQNAILRTQQN